MKRATKIATVDMPVSLDGGCSMSSGRMMAHRT